MFTPENSTLFYVIHNGYSEQEHGTDCACGIFVLLNNENEAVTMDSSFVGDGAFVDAVGRICFSSAKGSIKPESIMPMDELGQALAASEIARVQVWPRVDLPGAKDLDGGADAQRAVARDAVDFNLEAAAAHVGELQ